MQLCMQIRMQIQQRLRAHVGPFLLELFGKTNVSTAQRLFSKNVYGDDDDHHDRNHDHDHDYRNHDLFLCGVVGALSCCDAQASDGDHLVQKALHLFCACRSQPSEPSIEMSQASLSNLD